MKEIPASLLPLTSFIMRTLVRITGIPFVLKLKWLNFKYGKGKVPNEEISKLLGKHMCFDEESIKRMRTTAAFSQLLEKLHIPYETTYTAYLMQCMYQMKIETQEEADFAAHFHTYLIHQKPLRRSILNTLIRYGDVNTERIEKEFPGEVRAEFEEWLNAE